MPRRNKIFEVTIAESASLSGATLADSLAEYDSIVPTAVVRPGTWTAAVLTFQVSYDSGVTYSNLLDEGTEYEVAAVASAAVSVNTQVFLGATNIKVRSGTAAAAVNQAAARTLSVIALAVA